MKTGRPTLYREEFIDEVDKYLAICVDEEKEFHKTRGTNSNTYERIVKVNLPMIEGFAEYLGVSKVSLYEWEGLYKEFSNALDKIRLANHNALTRGTLSGTYNPVIAKLMLSHNHGYKEKTDVTTNDQPITALSAEDREALENAKRLLNG